MKNLYRITALVVLSSSVVSCFNDKNPNYQFFPNMYESVAYETYTESDVFAEGSTAQLPAEGSVPRGFTPYEYPNTPEGLEDARANLVSPLSEEDYNSDTAKALYTVYCAVCHGDAGDGQGTLVKREKFLGVPNYNDRVLTEGSIYHVITYGLNSMGSHANQLTQAERWQVSRYVMSLKAE